MELLGGVSPFAETDGRVPVPLKPLGCQLMSSPPPQKVLGPRQLVNLGFLRRSPRPSQPKSGGFGFGRLA